MLPVQVKSDDKAKTQTRNQTKSNSCRVGSTNRYLVGSNTYYTIPVQTKVGTGLTGIVQLEGGSGSVWNYTSGFEGGDGLAVVGAEELVWATLTLEVYGVEQDADFPTGSTLLYSTNIHTTTNTEPLMNWDCTSDTTDNIDCTVNTDGPVNIAGQNTT